MSFFGPVIGFLIFLSFLLPLVLIPLFDLWGITALLLVLLGIFIIVLAVFWYRENKKADLSVIGPAISIAAGVLIIAISIFLFITLRTRIPQLAKLAIVDKPLLTRKQCTKAFSEGRRPNGECFKFYPEVIETHDECKGLLDQRDFANVTDPILTREIENFDNCKAQCLGDLDPIKCFSNCSDQSRCFQFPDLEERVLGGLDIEPSFELDPELQVPEL